MMNRMAEDIRSDYSRYCKVGDRFAFNAQHIKLRCRDGELNTSLDE